MDVDGVKGVGMVEGWLDDRGEFRGGWGDKVDKVDELGWLGFDMSFWGCGGLRWLVVRCICSLWVMLWFGMGWEGVDGWG